MIKHMAQKLICLIPRGLTVTNSALITKTASISDSRITLECRNRRTSARNIFELLSIGMRYGDPVAVSACGEDAEETLKNIGMLLKEDALNTVPQ